LDTTRRLCLIARLLLDSTRLLCLIARPLLDSTRVLCLIARLLLDSTRLLCLIARNITRILPIPSVLLPPPPKIKKHLPKTNIISIFKQVFLSAIYSTFHIFQRFVSTVGFVQ